MGLNPCHQAIMAVAERLSGNGEINRVLINGFREGEKLEIFDQVILEKDDDEEDEVTIVKRGDFYPYFILGPGASVPHSVMVFVKGDSPKKMHGSSQIPDPRKNYLVLIFERPSKEDLESWSGPKEIKNLGCIGNVVVNNLVGEGVMVQRGKEREVYAVCH